MAKSEIGQQPWTATGAEKRSVVQSMFAEIAPIYDRLNGKMSLEQHHRWRAIAADTLELKPGDAVLDLCCGTGDFASPLRQRIGPTGAIVEADFCLPMLELAREKDGVKNGPSILAVADACQLPFASECFDGVAVGWGIRNVADPSAAFAEIVRVLKPGGRFVSIDMAIPRNPVARLGSRFVSRVYLPFLGRLFNSEKAYTYLPKSTERFMGREELSESMRNAGFEDVAWKDLFMGAICIHSGRKP